MYLGSTSFKMLDGAGMSRRGKQPSQAQLFRSQARNAPREQMTGAAPLLPENGSRLIQPCCLCSRCRNSITVKENSPLKCTGHGQFRNPEWTGGDVPWPHTYQRGAFKRTKPAGSHPTSGKAVGMEFMK